MLPLAPLPMNPPGALRLHGNPGPQKRDAVRNPLTFLAPPPTARLNFFPQRADAVAHAPPPLSHVCPSEIQPRFWLQTSSRAINLLPAPYLNPSAIALPSATTLANEIVESF